MSNVEDFISQDKDFYGKIFVDLSYAIDNVSPFVNEKILNGRKYVVKLPIIKKYIDLLDAAEKETANKGIFKIFGNNKYIDLLTMYKKDNEKDLNRLKNCSECACLNCSSACKFDSCLGCKEGAKIKKCDHSKLNISLHEHFILDLINEKTDSTDRYNVLATLQDVELDRKYIIFQSIHSSISDNSNDKFILYYYPNISDDTYGEITDADEFDYIAGIFESI